MKGISVYRRPQVIKLATLLDFYQADPYAQYNISMQNGYIQTNIEQNNSTHTSGNYVQSQQSSEQLCAVEEIDRMAKKTVGLFANLIKNIESSKKNACQYQAEQERLLIKIQESQFGNQENHAYQDQIKAIRGLPTKKVKQRATGLINVNFKKNEYRTNIENKENQTNSMKAKNHTNCQLPENNNRQTCIDINFSFEQIANQLEQRNNDKTTNQPSSQKEDKSRQMTHKSRQGNRTKEAKVELLNLNKQSKAGESSVEGAKKAESQVYSKGNDSSDIQIDFDLQIDF